MTETSNVHRLNIPRRRLPTSTLLEPSQFVLIIEEENGAMEFFGPFPSKETAMSFAEVTLTLQNSWWVTELGVPHIVEGIGREELIARGWRECGDGMQRDLSAECGAVFTDDMGGKLTPEWFKWLQPV
jgi:hypothetical protein